MYFLDRHMRKALLLFSILLSINVLKAQNIYKDNFAHTYSIVALDEKTGEMAVGVQSHWFSVGSLVSWGKSGVGVVATQSFVDPAYGPGGLKLLEEGKTPEEALKILLEKDKNNLGRQVAFLDVSGNAFAYTGEKCMGYASHITGKNFSVQANMMLNDKVVPAMAKAFEENKDLPLAQRVMKVLFAAEEAGGDIRGKQSAALIVVNAEKVEAWKDKKIDLRVDDDENPLIKLQQLLDLHTAYEYLNRGDEAIGVGDMKLALQEYGAAEKMFPENLEMKYWKAIAMANNGLVKETLPIFKMIFSKDPNWKELTKRLPKSDLLNVSEDDLKSILSQ